MIGLAGLHHLDRPQKPRPPDERKLAADVDLLEHVDDTVALVFAPRPGLRELGLGRVEVLVFAVSLLAHAHDNDVSGPLLHAGSSPPGWKLAPYERLAPHRGEGPGLRGQGPQPLRAWRRTDRRQEDRDALPGSLAGKPPRVCRSVSDFSERPRDDVWVLHRECAVGPRSSHRDPGRIGPGGGPVSSMH